MLTRVLEPEVMDTPLEARDYDAMDHAAINRAFVTDFLFAALAADLLTLPLPAEGTAAWFDVLDLGTGTAQIPIELCRRVPSVRVMAVDLAIEMLQVAQFNVETAGLRERIQLDRVDAKSLPYPAGMFAAVVSNSIVHHIPEPNVVLAEAMRVVRPGGLLFVRDLLRPADEATVRHLVSIYAGEANDHQRAMFEASLRAALSLDEIRELVASLGVAPETVAATSDRHWTWSARQNVSPAGRDLSR